MIRKISGKSKTPSYTHLNTCRETKATSKEDIANTLGETFLKNSSSRNYSEKIKDIKMQQEKNNINFKSLNNEEYNNPFTLLELIDAIQKSNDRATWPDEVHYQMLKHLPNNALSTILHIFNDIWATGVFTESWRLVTIYSNTQTRTRSRRTIKLQTNSSYKLSLQNFGENDKQKTRLVLRIQSPYISNSIGFQIWTQH